jgi:hypothetical protein
MKPTANPHRRPWRGTLLAMVLAIALPCAGGASAQALTEAQLRARFLINFLRFTEFPANAFPGAGAPLGLCVLGAGDPFEGALAEVQGATVGGHKVAVRSHVEAEQAADCQLLYVPDGELRRLAAARDAIGRHPVLIVGESEAVLDRGGMIALRDADRHLAFVVSLSPARHAALSFSPQMLHAAATVLP